MFDFVGYSCDGLNNAEIEILYSFSRVINEVKTGVTNTIIKYSTEGLLRVYLEKLLQPNFVENYCKETDARSMVFFEFLYELFSINTISVLIDGFYKEKKLDGLVKDTIKDKNLKTKNHDISFFIDTINIMSEKNLKKLLDIAILNMYNPFVRPELYWKLLSEIFFQVNSGYEKSSICYNETDNTVSLICQRDVESLFNKELIITSIIKKGTTNAGNL
jgi:hypothetical protein